MHDNEILKPQVDQVTGRGSLIACAAAGIGARIEQLGQPGVIQVGGERPTQLQGLGPAQQLLDPADTQLGAAADVADGQTGSVPESEYVS